jgi:hypothetical protein
MDIQNITNQKYSKQFSPFYKKSSALSIAITSREHYALTKCRAKTFFSMENLIYEEIKSLDNYTNIPLNIVTLISEELTNKYLKLL